MLSTFVPGLDALLGGGLESGTLCLVRGNPGAGRTGFGLQMAVASAMASMPSAFLALEDDPARVCRTASHLGLGLGQAQMTGQLSLIVTSGAAAAVDLHAHPGSVEVLALEQGVELCVIDGLAALAGARPLLRTRSGLVELRNALTRHEMTAVLLADAGAPETDAMAHVADALITLSVQQGIGGCRRQLTVEKQRGSAIQPGSYSLLIDDGGLRLEAAAELEHAQAGGFSFPPEVTRFAIDRLSHDSDRLFG